MPFAAIVLGALLVSATPGSLLLDDFSETDGLSSWGSRWNAFTDRVMGGVSDMEAVRHGDEEVPHLHMTGDVRLDNNGGFVQVALSLDGAGPVDASVYRAIRLRVRGNGERYYVHLRNDATRAPWQYYAASFEAPEEWTTVEIAFDDFEPRALGTPFDRSSLRRLGLVAYGREMQAELSVARVEFVR